MIMREANNRWEHSPMKKPKVDIKLFGVSNLAVYIKKGEKMISIPIEGAKPNIEGIERFRDLNNLFEE